MENGMKDEGQTAQEGSEEVGAASEGQAEGQSGAWYDSLDEDTRGYLENKGWFKPNESKPEDVLLENIKAYRELEKFKGANEKDLLKLPKEGDEEGLNEFYKKLGRPDEPSGYEFKPLEGQTPNEDMLAVMQDVMFKNGIPKEQGEALFSEYAKLEAQIAEQYAETINADQELQLHELKKEWGDQYNERKDLALRAAKMFGMESQDVDMMAAGWGTKKTYDMLSKMGDVLREDSRIDGDSTASFGMSPA
jgi:hypothetical protein